VSAPFLFKLLGAEGAYLQIALDYINVIFFGTVFFVLIQMFNASLTSIGDTKTFRNFLIVGFFLNIGLDPWFLFGGFGVPALGFKGIALATVIVNAIGSVYLGWRVVQTGLISKDCWHRMIPRKKYFKEIAHQGFPASINMMTVAIGIFVITYFVSWFGKEGVAAYGIATRIEQIALLPTIGLNIAALAIIGQNNGAKLYKRIRETWWTAMKYGLGVIVIGYTGVFIFAQQLMEIFSTDVLVVPIGVQYLRIATFVSFAYVILFISTSALQGMKKPLYAIWIGLYRQVAGPLALFYLLAVYLGFELLGIWWGVFIITWSSAIITLLYTRYVMKKTGVIEK
jgi:putative MATE family efflux protein